MIGHHSIEVYEELLRIKRSGDEGVLVTVVEKLGSGPAEPGAKMLVCADGSTFGTVGGGEIEFFAINEAKKVMKSQKSVIKKYSLNESGRVKTSEKTEMICGGNTTLFYEYIAPAKRIYIFGGGHIGKALCRHLKNLNFHITVIDNRAGIDETISDANRVIICEYEKALHNEDVPEGSFFVVVTPSHRHDFLVVKRIYESGWKPAYIGLIASKRKAKRTLDKLLNELGDKVDRSILYTPIGLDIGGDTPDEIAISIIAEIQAIRYGRSGHIHKRI